MLCAVAIVGKSDVVKGNKCCVLWQLWEIQVLLMEINAVCCGNCEKFRCC
jgi:hypothetical protein